MVDRIIDNIEKWSTYLQNFWFEFLVQKLLQAIKIL